MEYYSILFDDPLFETTELNEMPEFFKDLNLDQIINEIIENKEEYNLDGYFYKSLKDASTIIYRQKVMKDLENTDIYDILSSFAKDMKKVRAYTSYSTSLHNQYQRKKWHLDAVNLYCDVLNKFKKSLVFAELESEGLKLFRDWMIEYVDSLSFKELYTDTKAMVKEFDNIKYSLQVEKNKIVVEYDNNDKEDYCAEIINTFKHTNDSFLNCNITFFTEIEMNSLETRILDIVKLMYNDTFYKLDEYCTKHSVFIDNTIIRFDREIQFYISYHGYIGRLKKRGFNFAYPKISYSKIINVTGGYDLALAYKLINSQNQIVPNDFYLNKNEKIFILTGPNQGGKTTFARAFGQILFLASIGCPVPCQSAELFLFNDIFTHFAEEEDISKNEGRLKAELSRLNQIIKSSTSNSILIINELFATTTSLDAYTMGKRIIEYFTALDCVCLYVTHIYELAEINDKTVSLVAEVDTGAGAARTYKISRKLADGRVYANSVVDKYNLNYSQLKERLKI